MSSGTQTSIRVRKEHERTFAPGDTVFDVGDLGERLYVIQAGEVELSREEAGGRAVVARLGAGDFFGELGVVLGTPCTTRAVAISKARILELDREVLEAMCLEQPEIAMRMIRVLVSRLIEAERRLAVLGIDDLMRPLVRTLVRRAEPGQNEGFQIPLNLRGLADEAGLSMLAAHRGLHQLLDRKVVDLIEDRLVTADLDALSAALD